MAGTIDTPPVPLEPREGVPDLITDTTSLRSYANRLMAGSGPVALDAERASGFRYSQRAYLIQVRRSGAGSALIDPIAVTDMSPLAEALAGTEWILHAATQDLPCLAEVGLVPDRLFDTELAGRLLGRERVGLSALVESELGAHLEKGHGATDWSVRPLSAAQLRYAALDVELLIELRDALEEALIAAGKQEIAREEFDALLSFQPRERTDEDWRRTSGLNRVRSPRGQAIVRELWRERDAVAQERDVAVGRLLPDAALIAAASTSVTSADELITAEGFHGRGARRHLRRWWQAYARALALPESDLPTRPPRIDGPPPARAWADRDPEAHARLSAARAELNGLAEHMQMPVENLLTPEVVRRLCWQPPAPCNEHAITGFLRAAGARPWQVATCAPVLLAAVTDAPKATDG